MIRDWIDIARRPEFRRSVVFLEDYDIALALELVQGVDIWINTPRRPWEACGTSGMKVLVNGGLNLSERDGWWEEAYAPELGWAIGDGREYPGVEHDAQDAEALYSVLEQEIIPAFYARDAAGLPRQWLERVRRSLAVLTPIYSSSRMARDYVEQYYLAGGAELRRRTASQGELARAMRRWELRLRLHWPDLRIGEPTVSRAGADGVFSVPVDLGEIAPEEVAVQLYADPYDGGPPFLGELCCAPAHGHIYTGSAPASRPAEDYTVRIIPRHPGAVVPTELPLILWAEMNRGSSVS
jgi:starch phosphorylase